MIQGVHHISFTVKDLHTSEKFYAHLGFRKIWSIERDQSQELRVQTGYPDATFSITQLEAPGSSIVLELIEYHNGGGRPATDIHAVQRSHVGAAHMCLKVDDMEKTVLDLRSKGIQTVSEPQYFDDDSGIYAVYFEDPDGITVELIEELKREDEKND